MKQLIRAFHGGGAQAESRLFPVVKIKTSVIIVMEYISIIRGKI